MPASVRDGRRGLAYVHLEHPSGAAADVYLHGGHVTSWRAPEGVERLFLSERAVFDGVAAIRGGVPVIFPQFAAQGSLPKHGFARTALWRVAADAATDGPSSVTLELVDTPDTRAVFPHAFVARHRIEIGIDTLRLELHVENRGIDSFAFTAALHTYLRVDAYTTTLHGLDTAFRDSTAGGVLRPASPDAVRVTGEINRVYFGVPHRVQVHTPHATFDVEQSGFPDVVLWNPGREGAALLPDMRAEDAADMLCVEAAVIGDPVHLAPGEEWTAEQRIAAR